MKRLSLFLAIVLVVFQGVNSANILGRVIDSATNSSIEFVTVSVFNPATQKNIGGAITNVDGHFNIASVPNGNFELRVSLIGYDLYSKELKVEGANIVVGDIALVENTKTLRELQVVGQGSQMRFDIDKKVFSVDQNIAAAGGSTTDVLQNIPSVEVDNDGNISLRNNSSVEIWINGRPSGLTADNRAQVLQQMPAENLESIEVMTNPSAKFNPEGTAGIINLVMKKNRKAGYYGSLSAGSSIERGKPGYNLGGNINYSVGKFDMFANIGFRQMNNKGSHFTDRTNFNNGDTTLLTQNGASDMKRQGLFARAGIDYMMNDKNTIGVNGFAHYGQPNSGNVTSYLLTQKETDEILRDYSRDNQTSNIFNGFNVNLYHKIDFDSEGSNLLTNISLSRHGHGSEQWYVQDDKLSLANNQDITQTSDGSHNGLEIKSDLTKKFSANSKLEVGWSSRWISAYSEADGTDNLLKKPIEAYYNIFDYSEQTHAVYATYGGRIDNFSAQIGARGEYFVTQSTTTPSETLQPIKSDYFKLFPSIYLSYALPANNELQLNYTRRINRPRGRQINSYRDYSDSTNIVYGNPGLTPEFASAIEFNYLKNWDNHTLSTSLYYRFTDDVIERISFMNEGTMESTYMNLTKRQDLGLELVAKNRLFRILNLTTSVNMYHSRNDSATYIHPLNNNVKVGIPSQNTFSWDARMIANLMLSPTLSGQITGNYRSAQLLAQGERDAVYSVDLGLRKTFFDRKLTLSANVRDLLNSRSFTRNTWGEGFYQYAKDKRRGRMVGVTVTYNFGNMMPKQKPRELGGEDEMNGAGEMDNGMD